ncbi:unnamed protein product [Tenebrio molitor]|nr:unnamed protein product [Tenebrio molitor]
MLLFLSCILLTRDVWQWYCYKSVNKLFCVILIHQFMENEFYIVFG